MKPSRSYNQKVKQWVGQSVSCFIRTIEGKPQGPYLGTVKGLSTNEAAAEDEGKVIYEATGLLVEIPELGRNVSYGEWPVWFSDAALI